MEAVVIGAGVAGLVATRVLSEAGAHVTLIERDYLGISGARKGVAQARHLHVLLRRGRLALEELFPGLDDSLARAGAPEIDWSLDTAWLSRYGWFPRERSGVTTRSCSRALLESEILERVLALPGVDAIERQEAGELEIDSGRVHHVRVGARRLRADLVIDATGRGSRFTRSTLTQGVDASIGYASRIVRLREDALDGCKQLYVQMRPPENHRGGVLIPLESGLHMVTLVGAGKDYPPSDDFGFAAFAKSLHDPSFSAAIRGARPMTEISAYRRTMSHRILDAAGAGGGRTLPTNLLSVGDSYCAFNPVYGQGMTVAALSALALREALREGEPSRARVQAKLAKLTNPPWMLGSSEDMRVRSVRLDRVGLASRASLRAFPGFTDLVLRKAARSASTHRRFLRVLHLLDSPASLLKAFVPGDRA